MNCDVTPRRSNRKSSATPSIVEPFLATVKLLSAQLLPSVKTTTLPTVGLAGNVTVNAPPVVSAIIC